MSESASPNRSHEQDQLDLAKHPGLQDLYCNGIHFRQPPCLIPDITKPEIKMADYEYTEHSYLGDNTFLKWTDNEGYPASTKPITLPNGLCLTYGEITALAGDFYGTDLPISDGENLDDQKARFQSAWDTLATETTRQPKEAESILEILHKEIAQVNEAIASNEHPSKIYSRLADETEKFQALTVDRPINIPSYLGLAKLNFDSFGKDAHTAYAAGHSVALDVARSGDLPTAYAINAFADHFLEATFSAGYLRTPRRLLHKSINHFHDLLAKFMHDEDSAIGLLATNKISPYPFPVYSSAFTSSPRNNGDLSFRRLAVQASADEVHTAYLTRGNPDQPLWNPDEFAAWQFVPNLDYVNDPTNQELAALFLPDGTRRTTIEDRKTKAYKGDWWAATSAYECWNSGWWEWPIGSEGPKKE